MRKVNTTEGERFLITGKLGQEYKFICKEISIERSDSFILLTKKMIVYIFVQDIHLFPPLMIDIGYSNQWDIKLKDMENFNKIKNTSTKNFLYLFINQNDNGKDICEDIEAGDEFDKSLLSNF